MTAAKIAALNDAARTTLQDCRLVVTCGVAALGDVDAIIAQVQTFGAFTPDNDPYGEHDFGSFEFGDERQLIFWKFDYYDLDLLMHSLDASDISTTRRVLTVMLADEF